MVLSFYDSNRQKDRQTLYLQCVYSKAFLWEIINYFACLGDRYRSQITTGLYRTL